MPILPLTWGRYVTLVLAYWILIVGGWIFYTTRPSTQRHAREQASITEARAPATGRVTLIVSRKITIKFVPIGIVFLGPPIAVLIAWLTLRRK